MKLPWSPETAMKAYIDAVKSCENLQKPGVVELVAAMAAGWNARLIVETWSEGKAIAMSIGLNVASNHTGGRHVCIVPNTQSRSLYLEAMKDSTGKISPPEIIIGEPKAVMQQLKGIDFCVVDIQDKSFATMLQQMELGHDGAVLVCQNTYSKARTGFSWGRALGDGVSRRLACSLVLPVETGLEIVRVGAFQEGLSSKSKWIRHVDKKTGEEHVIRR